MGIEGVGQLFSVGVGWLDFAEEAAHGAHASRAYYVRKTTCYRGFLHEDKLCE